MGCESFQVLLPGCDFNPRKVCEYLADHRYVSVDKETSQLREERYFIYRDSTHIIEIEVEPGGNSWADAYVSCRFALCHPSSIDGVFTEFVRSMAGHFGFTIEIKENFPEADNDRIFSPPLYKRFEAHMRGSIATKRYYWVADFGPKTATLRCSEALRKYMAPG